MMIKDLKNQLEIDVDGACTGCKAMLRYTLVIERNVAGMPEVYAQTGAVAFAGGHLCQACQAIVWDALNAAHGYGPSIGRPAPAVAK